MPYYMHATDTACWLRLRRDTTEPVEKKAREFLTENYWGVGIEYPDGRIRNVELIRNAATGFVRAGRLANRKSEQLL